MIAPIMTKPFLAPDQTKVRYAIDSMGNNTTVRKHLPVNYILSALEIDSRQKEGFAFVGQSLQNSSAIVEEKSATKIQYAFLTVGIFCLITSIWMAFTFFKGGAKFINSDMQPTEEECSSTKRANQNVTFTFKVYALIFVFNLFYAGIEIGYAGLVMTFAVGFLGWTKSNGTTLVAIVQLTNATVTALAIIYSKFVKANVIIAIDIVIVFISLLVLVLLVERFPWMIWVSSSILGAGYATIMPSTFTWANSFLEVTGKFSSFYWSGFFVGFMVVPAITGYLLNEIHAMWFPYCMLICSIGMAITFVILLWVVNKYQHSDSKSDQ